MAQTTIQGPDSENKLPNTRNETAENGWSIKRIINAVNAMFTELYGTGVTAAAFSSGDGAPDDTVQATFSTNLTGDNNDLTYTAVLPGADGNAVTVRYSDPAANDAELSVSVTGTAITVNLATGVAGAITTIASEIVTAIEASEAASALVTVADKAANNGTGEVTAMAATPLANGADATGQGTAGTGVIYVDTTTPDLYINAGTADAVEWKLITRAA